MRIIITENQYRLLENKTKYDFGFDLFKDMVYERYPFIKKIVIDGYKASGSENKGFHIISLTLYINYKEMYNFKIADDYDDNPFDGLSDTGLGDVLEDSIGLIYDRVPKNVRYNYPKNHDTWPGEAAGINIKDIIGV
jgi:hypothetical protein